MLTLNSIRKEILQALHEQIIPALWQRRFALGSAGLPWNWPREITPRLLSSSVPQRDRVTPEFPLQARWSRAGLHASVYPYFGLLYEGSADERTLVTASQARQYGVEAGVHALRWHAPALLLFPSGTPRNSGDSSFWQEPTPAPARKILWFSLGPALLLHTHIAEAGGAIRVSHSLQISEAGLLEQTRLFIRELENPQGDRELASALILTCLLAVVRELRSGRVRVANTARLPLLMDYRETSETAANLARQAAIHVQMHMHEPLTLPDIARRVGVSPAHLNRRFRQQFGVSLMRYARRQRVAAAKRILLEGNENIAEIAKLVGFKNSSAFCDVFRRETGVSPGRFRRSRYGQTFSDSDETDGRYSE